MFNLKYSTFAPYNVEQMFYLVNDVNSYYKFIPGCNSSKVLDRYGDNEIIAELVLVFYGISKSLVTRNLYVKNEKIVISLVRGPCKFFYGCWKFFPITTHVSRIEYISYYEFHSIFIANIFNNFFQEKYKNIIESFFFRAAKIYDT